MEPGARPATGFVPEEGPGVEGAGWAQIPGGSGGESWRWRDGSQKGKWGVKGEGLLIEAEGHKVGG